MQENSLTEEIRLWVRSALGWFTSRECDQDLGIITKEDKHTRRQALYQLVKDGVLNRHPTKQGMFRPVETGLVKMNPLVPSIKGERLKLPLGIHKFFKVYPGNIIIIAGHPQSGKTAFLLNVVEENFELWKIHYFNSEMAEEELSDRLRYFKDVPPENWEKYANFYQRSSDFADVIVPGRGNLNIIDYMEIHDKHYLIGAWIKDIYDKLNGALAIIAIQKDPYKDWGRGGQVTEEKARLYLVISSGEITIKKCKNRKDPAKNADGLQMKFKLVGGSLFLPQDQWSLPEDNNG